MQMRHQDGHPQMFQRERVWFQLGNERTTAATNKWCGVGTSCTDAFLRFAEEAQGKARELGLADSLR